MGTYMKKIDGKSPLIRKNEDSCTNYFIEVPFDVNIM